VIANRPAGSPRNRQGHTEERKQVRDSRRAFSRRSFVGAGVAGAAALLAACSQAPAAPTAAPAAPAPAPTAAAKPPEPAVKATEPAPTTAPVAKPAGAPAGGIVEVTVLHPFGDAVGGKGLTLLVDEFHKQQPGIKLSLSYATQANFDIGKKLAASVAGGDPFNVYTANAEVVEVVREGLAVALDPFIQRDKFDTKPILPMMLEHITYGGKVMAVPIEYSNLSIWYHQDLREKAGLPALDHKKGWTWSEYREDLKKLTVSEGGKVVQWGTQVANNWRNDLWFNAWLWNAGGEYFNAAKDKVAYNSPEGVEAVTFMVELCNKDKVAPPNGEQIARAFDERRIANHYGGPWSWGYFVGDLKLKASVAPMPRNKKAMTVAYGGSFMAIKSKPEKIEASWQFLKHVASKESNLVWTLTTGYLPFRQDVVDDARYQTWLKETAPQMQQFIDNIAVAKPYEGMHFGRQPERAAIFKEELDKALFGKVTPKEALDAAAARINADKTFFQEVT
jgi:multiple sugar transport system substrate-binding protein